MAAKGKKNQQSARQTRGQRPDSLMEKSKVQRERKESRLRKCVIRQFTSSNSSGLCCFVFLVPCGVVSKSPREGGQQPHPNP